MKKENIEKLAKKYDVPIKFIGEGHGFAILPLNIAMNNNTLSNKEIEDMFKAANKSLINTIDLYDDSRIHYIVNKDKINILSSGTITPII